MEENGRGEEVVSGAKGERLRREDRRGKETIAKRKRGAACRRASRGAINVQARLVTNNTIFLVMGKGETR